MKQDYSPIQAFHLIFIISMMLVLCKASAKKLQVRAGKTGGLRDGWGIAIFCRSVALSERSGAKILQPEVLPELPGKGSVRKEASLLT
jgi:hypothetical protein